ncbi:MAG: tRNA (adenosine(37)-N6)-threonylcarbamoyltransferase complex dimerization subunit type 1 TsaB [Alphaproteobacteria bacterium]|jgi:tRNA threonylcarbamoyladenosine biosynthesis protein TsaB|nr:tRNA (adenosine(37)-N6)-threonylcarbamoyltransferase complex dimerization subunit type 1 TsaB [Alphaproteobacteria bacterium]
MRMLAIECATEACSVALFEGAGADARLLDHRHEVIGRGHAERLVPMIAELPERGRAERILVSRGPGSFTGTRIGLATARALAIAWGAQVAGFATLGLVAATARTLHDADGSALLVAMSGGHGEYFVQCFDAQGLPVADHRSLAPEQAAHFSDAPLVAGSRAEDLVALRGSGQAFEILPDARFASALPAALLSDRLAPIYGRPPDAKLPA